MELLPDSSTFIFANGQEALASEKCRVWSTDFSIIDEGEVPLLMSVRGTPEKIIFIAYMTDSVVKDCEVCQKTKPAPPESRFSGVRAKDFGGVFSSWITVR